MPTVLVAVLTLSMPAGVGQLSRAEGNGLALCLLPHRTFGLGAFTVNGEGVLLVSDQAHGTAGFQE